MADINTEAVIAAFGLGEEVIGWGISQAPLNLDRYFEATGETGELSPATERLLLALAGLVADMFTSEVKRQHPDADDRRVMDEYTTWSDANITGALEASARWEHRDHVLDVLHDGADVLAEAARGSDPDAFLARVTRKLGLRDGR